ncbi:hypothetical protein [Lactobacillus taiwanensis]|uniref:hypothetical protein n=1 Tax=Lactobacillus taiwanensis TaxID=508451 RepID=UPI00241CF7B2|nr:hypothetical protein [Lactobacillus taiwanensis]
MKNRRLRVISGCLSLLFLFTMSGCSSHSSTVVHTKSTNNASLSKKRSAKSSKSKRKVVKSNNKSGEKQRVQSQTVQQSSKSNIQSQPLQNKVNSQQAVKNSKQNNTPQVNQYQNTQPQSQLPPANSLSDFVNKYGVSPSLYLMQHNNMSSKQALEAVPDNMKTSGELQTQHNMEQNNN